MEEYRLHETHPEGYSLCVWVRERLPDLQEGFLDAATAETIRAHLSVCFLCAREYNEMEATVKLIESLPFVDPVKDHAPAILAAIRSQSDHSFRSPVVEVETEALTRISMPRATTGQQRRAGYSLTDLTSHYLPDGTGRMRSGPAPEEQIAPGERAALAAMLATLLFALILSPWGRSVPAFTAEWWAGRALPWLLSLPLAGFAVNLLQAAAAGAERLYQMAASGPALLISVNLLFAAAYFVSSRRQLQSYVRL